MLTKEEKVEIVLIHGEDKTHRETATIFNQRHPEKSISHTTVGRIFKKFLSTGSVENEFKKPHAKWIMDEQEENVLLDVIEHQKTSLAAISNRTGSKPGTARNILKKNKYHPYKPKFTNKLQERDLAIRFDFCAWVQGELEENRTFAKYILFSDEATFSSNGVVSSQNCRWWADENPKFIIGCKDQYSFKINVWCGIFNGRLIGPYFFQRNLNAERYLTFLSTEIANEIDNMSLAERSKLWFQHDGASIHCTVEVRNYLDDLCRGKWIGRYSQYPWPARSPDLTPLDFFLWGYLKQKVYQKRPFQNINHLERTIREVCSDMPPSFLRNTIKDFSRRTVTCMEREGRCTET